MSCIVAADAIQDLYVQHESRVGLVYDIFTLLQSYRNLEAEET